MTTGTRKTFPTQCKYPGCGELTHQVYCEEHADNRQEVDKLRASASKRGYDARWRRYRKNYLAKHPLCADCGTLATVIDHIVPHKGNRALFWDENNHQSLCESCHNRKTASEEMESWNTHEGLK